MMAITKPNAIHPPIIPPFSLFVRPDDPCVPVSLARPDGLRASVVDARSPSRASVVDVVVLTGISTVVLTAVSVLLVPTVVNAVDLTVKGVMLTAKIMKIMEVF